jgi:NAD+ diphosphatase
VSSVFVPAVAPAAQAAGDPLWFVFAGDELLVAGEDDVATLPSGERAALGLGEGTPLYLGDLDGRPCYALRLDGGESPAGLSPSHLRALYGRIDDPTWAVAGRAFQLLEWERTSRFCGHCGTATVDAPGERAKRCPSCGLQLFPRLSPAVIVLVERDGQMLLAQGQRFRGSIYSCLAGFVEPGETLEQAVAREVGEEVGLTVRDVRYFSSQPWPFPHQIMIGFTATADPGELRLDPEEIVDAGWFSPDGPLPELPGKLSIARRLIDAYLARPR